MPTTLMRNMQKVYIISLNVEIGPCERSGHINYENAFLRRFQTDDDPLEAHGKVVVVDQSDR